LTEYNFETMRRAMVASQLRTTAVNDPRVVDAMGAVPREPHVPEARKALSYADVSLPLGGGRALTQPMALGRLLTEAAPESDDHALVVGAATGYSAAVLARMVASVVALEEDPALLAMAQASKAEGNIRFVSGPLVEGWAAEAPYDLILIDGAVEYVPDAIIAQLSERGRIAVAIIDEGVTRLSIGRRGGGGFGLLAFADTEIPALPMFIRPREFTF
jgi:protein-L-isoaspartate(D-aspartate) O-methyltransferase